MTLPSIVSFVICALIVLFVVKVIFKGTKSAIGILINIAVGAVALWILDIIGLGLPITWLTAGIVGLLGVPGVVILLVLKYLLHLI